MAYLIRVSVGKDSTSTHKLFWLKSAKIWVGKTKKTFETLEEAQTELEEASENLPENATRYAQAEIFEIPEIT